MIYIMNYAVHLLRILIFVPALTVPLFLYKLTVIHLVLTVHTKISMAFYRPDIIKRESTWICSSRSVSSSTLSSITISISSYLLPFNVIPETNTKRPKRSTIKRIVDTAILKFVSSSEVLDDQTQVVSNEHAQIYDCVMFFLLFLILIRTDKRPLIISFTFKHSSLTPLIYSHSFVYLDLFI